MNVTTVGCDWDSRAAEVYTVHVRLTRKLADCLDGIDVSCYRPGDVLDLPDADAELLIAEGWADRRREIRSSSVADPRALAADRSVQRTLERLQREIEMQACPPTEHRRAEDRIRDQFHDTKSTTLNK